VGRWKEKAGGADSAAITVEDAGKRLGGGGGEHEIDKVENCSLNIERRHKFVIEYIHISLFLNINSFWI
jgi:hypothetical protein